jgi:hypothetical protein
MATRGILIIMVSSLAFTFVVCRVALCVEDFDLCCNFLILCLFPSAGEKKEDIISEIV